MKKSTERKIYTTIIGVLVIGILVAFSPSMGYHSQEEQRETFISLKSSIQDSLLPDGKYRCCLEKPCTYCIEKTTGHGEGATCDCLSDIVNGKHPCGECIGEILEGHGNKYLSKYFAQAIADEVGKEHLPTLQQIIFEKYGTPVEEQYII